MAMAVVVSRSESRIGTLHSHNTTIKSILVFIGKTKLCRCAPHHHYHSFVVFASEPHPTMIIATRLKRCSRRGELFQKLMHRSPCDQRFQLTQSLGRVKFNTCSRQVTEIRKANASSSCCTCITTDAMLFHPGQEYVWIIYF